MQPDAAVVHSGRTRLQRPIGLVLSAFVVAAAMIFANASSASAASTPISGWQNEMSNVYWATQRSNAYSANYMRISPYNGANLGIAAFTAGARGSAAAGASFAKTAAIRAGYSGNFLMVSSGSTVIGPGTFYLTTYLGASGCGCEEALNWSAVFYYSVPA